MEIRTIRLVFLTVLTSYLPELPAAITEDLSLVRDCPSPDSILPCTCDAQLGKIECSKLGELKFAEVFGSLEDFAEETGSENYDWDLIEIKSIINDEIPADAFGNITARELRIVNCWSISSIHPSVIAKMSTRLEALTLSSNFELRNYNEIFETLSQEALNLRQLYISNTDHLNEIPDYAFSGLRNLESITITYAAIKYIGAKAFSELDNLRTLRLMGYTSVAPFFHPQAFELQNTSDQDLLVDMSRWLSSLTPPLIDHINFAGFQGRKVALNLTQSYTPEGGFYLNETTFQPFLDDNPENIIEISYVGDCKDCNHAWLLRKKLIDNRVIADAGRPELSVQCLFGIDTEPGYYEDLVNQNFEHC